MEYTRDALLKIRAQFEPWLLAQPGIYATIVDINKRGSRALKIFTEDKVTNDTYVAVITKLRDVPIAWEAKK